MKGVSQLQTGATPGKLFYTFENQINDNNCLPSKNKSSAQTANHVPKESKRPDQVDDVNFNPNILGQVGLGWTHNCYNHPMAKIGQP